MSAERINIGNIRADPVRPLNGYELNLYLEHLLNLSRQCRRSRFGNEVKDIFLREYVARVDLQNTLVLDYFNGALLLGVAEVRSMRTKWCADAEVAFSVEQSHRTRDVGTALMRCALERAARIGIAQLHLICDGQNRAMQRVAEKVEAEVRFEESDCMCCLRVPPTRRSNALAAA